MPPLPQFPHHGVRKCLPPCRAEAFCCQDGRNFCVKFSCGIEFLHAVVECVDCRVLCIAMDGTDEPVFARGPGLPENATPELPVFAGGVHTDFLNNKSEELFTLDIRRGWRMPDLRQVFP